MRPLLIGPEEKESLKALKENAEQNKFSFDDLLDMYNGQQEIVGDRKGFSCIIPHEYRVVFSIEEQFREGKPIKTRHASVSVSTEGLPNVAAVEAIISELGFGPMHNCILSLEKESKAINVIEIIE